MRVVKITEDKKQIDSKEKSLGFYFEEFINRKSIFSNKGVLQSSYHPEILHRESEKRTISQVLGPLLRLERPSNFFIYGKTGCGKTATLEETKKFLAQYSEKNNLPIKIISVNCKQGKNADTEYRLIAHLAREFDQEIPTTGLATNEIYKIFYNAIEKGPKITLLILDEIDYLVKKVGDDMLYSLTRMNENLERSQVAIVGISNDLTFANSLDPRVKSSLSEEELFFKPYNATQLQDILRARSQKAFNEGVVGEGVIEKCAAYAAREHGDARRALELLRVAGEVAEREGNDRIQVSDVDLAEDKIDKDSILDVVAVQPKHAQVVLYSIMQINTKKQSLIFTGEIYELYKRYIDKVNLRPLTQRRVSDIIAEFDMLGIINAKVISKGRYGRTREITVATQDSVNKDILKVLSDTLML